MIGALAAPEKIFFKKLVTLLRKVSLNSDKNKMTSVNLSIVWGPNLIKPSTREVDLALCDSSSNGLFLFLQTCIDEYDAVFPDNWKEYFFWVIFRINEYDAEFPKLHRRIRFSTPYSLPTTKTAKHFFIENFFIDSNEYLYKIKLP